MCPRNQDPIPWNALSVLGYANHAGGDVNSRLGAQTKT